MRVLVACEESQAVCKAFRQLGHEAYSCDLQECTGGHPEWHIHVDALELLKMKWDMLIAFPPCTYMTKAGAVRMRRGGCCKRIAFKRPWMQRGFLWRSTMRTFQRLPLKIQPQ